jgi:hypothetical protein
MILHFQNLPGDHEAVNPTTVYLLSMTKAKIKNTLKQHQEETDWDMSAVEYYTAVKRPESETSIKTSSPEISECMPRYFQTGRQLAGRHNFYNL